MVFGDGQSNGVIQFYLDPLWLPWQRNWDKMGYNSTYVRDIFEILASNKGF